jgi:hypothetical protein
MPGHLAVPHYVPNEPRHQERLATTGLIESIRPVELNSGSLSWNGRLVLCATMRENPLKALSNADLPVRVEVSTDDGVTSVKVVGCRTERWTQRAQPSTFRLPFDAT